MSLIPENREYHVNLFDDAWLTVRIDVETTDNLRVKFEGSWEEDFAKIEFNDLRGAADRLREVADKINSVWVEWESSKKSKVKRESTIDATLPIVSYEP